MTAIGLVQILLFLAVLVALARPLGLYMARVYEGRPCGLDRWLAPVERALYRLAGVDPQREMDWRSYAGAFLVFNALGLAAVYALLRCQGWLPWNPAGLPAVPPHTAFNVAVSFASNTNWQSYGGETTLSYLSQMAALTVQNFVSAAAGMAVLVALARALKRRESRSIGNFWADLVRSTLYVLLPLALILALALVSQGVVQTLAPAAEARLLDPYTGGDGATVSTQTLARGPAASQIAIKQLGTNGGGFFNVNSAHPFENPSPLANFLETLAILILPAALCVTFGALLGRRREGWALLAAMLLLFVPFLALASFSEQAGNPILAQAGVDQAPSALQSGGNLEGKEVRFGVVSSTLWATATTAASNGSVNSMHDSYTPLGGLAPMVLMQLGEVVFGGVGSGLYGLLMFAFVAVFVAGLMVGRTPEYLGKKVEAHEMKMASLAILVPCFAVLLGTAFAVAAPAGLAGLLNPGAHGLSEILYAFSSAGNNNGSAFGGLTVNTGFYDTATGLAMLFARYWVAIPVLAIAGSMARKKQVPAGPGTLPTDRPLFVFFLASVVILVGALTFLPALALGPIAEHLQLCGRPLSPGRSANMSSPRTPSVRARHRRVARSSTAFRKLDPRVAAAQPGDVRRRGRRLRHHRRSPRSALGRRRHLDRVRPGGLGLALVHCPVRQLRRGDGGGARQGAGRRAAGHARAHRRRAWSTSPTATRRSRSSRRPRCARATWSSSRPARRSPPTARSSRASLRSTRAR